MIDPPLTIKEFYEMACEKGIENLRIERIVIEDLSENFEPPSSYYVEKKTWEEWDE